jgi:hypothetical protein
VSGYNLPDNLWRYVLVAASGNRGTHTYFPAAARRTYHPSERAAELRYVSPDSFRIPRKTGTDSGTAATWERRGDSRVLIELEDGPERALERSPGGSKD